MGDLRLRGRAIVSGVSCGTLGELFQGPYWEADEPQISIISLPVPKYTWCYFIPESGSSSGEATDGLADRTKSAAAVRGFLDRYGLVLPEGRWEFHSELPVGKGMASSTADIVAAVRCLFNLFGIPYDQRVLVDILSSIERSDTVFLDGITLYLSGQQRVVRGFEAELGLYTCYVVEDRCVVTEDLGHELLQHYLRNASSYRDCLAAMVDALDRNDVRDVASGASRSAELSQQVVPKVCYEQLADSRRELGADGVFVAHTGSVIGYLFAQRPSRSAMDELSAFFRGLGRQCHFAKAGCADV